MGEKNYTRWYDKEEDLSIVMKALEFADDDTKLAVAADLIQMVMSKRDTETDEFIEEINEEYIPVRRRWYDKFETLFSAIEMLKYLSPEERSDTLKEVINSIIYFQNKDK